ncbi:hypothetical protein TWF506_000045 [Arthrobotrys conoides]|uniref:Uncharacterized protein n=1 Tax=Arthrobotrys conoides TaxID=74498 RepID=A0AAN8NY82_9PEZI
MVSSKSRVDPMTRSPEDGEDSPSDQAPDDPKGIPKDESTMEPLENKVRLVRPYTATELETAQYLAQIAQQIKITAKPTVKLPPVRTGKPIGVSNPTEKNLRFAEQGSFPVDALPLHPSVYIPFDPKDHPSRVNDFETLEKRLLRLGLTCTYPPQSFNRPMGNPEWSLKSIFQSRSRAGTDPKVVEYEAEFVWANGLEASRQWLTFDELNWPWGIRIMRIFHQRNMFRPMDRRMQDRSVLDTEARVERSEWFNGKDIYKEEYLSKAIYEQTKYEQVELYNQTAAANESMNRDRNIAKMPPPISPPPRGKGKESIERPRERALTRSPPRGDGSDTEMTDVTSVSDHSYYSEGEDPEMQAIYQKAKEDFEAGGSSRPRQLSADKMEKEPAKSRLGQKSEEEEAADKAIWREKMRGASERIKAARQLSMPTFPKKRDENGNVDPNGPKLPPPFDKLLITQPKLADVWRSYSGERSGSGVPPAALPTTYNTYNDKSKKPALSSQPPKLATLSQLLADIKVTPPVRYEKPLAKKKGTKSRSSMGGKERNLGMSVEDKEEGVGGSKPTTEFDEDFDADTEDAGDVLDPLASKRSRESAGSHRGDLKRTRFFDQGGKMEGVEEGEKSEEDEEKQSSGLEESKADKGDGTGDDGNKGSKEGDKNGSGNI